MLTSDPAAQFEELKGALLSQIEKTFPIQDKSGRFEVRVKDLNVTDNKGTEDIKEQQRVREQGRSWEAPVHGTVEVVDLSTGKTLVSRKQRLTSIPKMTRHYSWIIGGQELTLTNQWRLRPGAYVKATERPGEYEAQFQLAKGKSFDIQQEETGNLYMKIGGRKVPLYSVLHNFGVSDDAMKRAWGEEAFESSKKKSKLDKDLISLHTAWRGEAPAGNPGEAVKTLFAATQLDPEIAKANVGVHSPQVNGTMLLEASRKLVDVSADRARPDPIDSLRYKELWTAKDHIVERLARSSEDIATRVRSSMKKPSTQRRLLSGDSEVLRDVVMPDLLRRPMYYPFTTSLAAPSRQTNPIAMLADRSATTIMGPGGIQNQHQITASNTAIDPSHLGFLDPVFTPEGNPGVTTHLAAGVRTSPDRRPVTWLYNLKTKKLEDVDAARASTSVVVLPDQVKWEAGHPKPRGAKIKVIDGHGELRDDMGFGQAHYVMPDTSQVFALETNLVPFMQNDSAGRTTMSARHMAQAISVVGREPPMVRVEAGGGKTFEELIGSGFLSHRAPVSGIVTKVAKDEITLRDSAGKAHSVHLYNHYPTNETKGMLHSTPLVQVGQAVKTGQVLADNNHTKNGALALGTNVRAAYLANGYNHEDGIVISESAAAKLASQHLYKPSLYTTDSTVIGKKQFLLSKPGVFSMDRLSKIDDDGTVKVGTKVKPGDPLILALGENRVNSSIDASTVQRLGAKLRDRYSNSSLVWDSNYEGEVVGVHRSGRNVVVHVKTLEPAQIGSKISTRHSAKGIVTQILADKDMPHDDKGRHVEMLINSVSVPGRQNPGQILETAAGKIAEKTGKPYVVKNFMGGVDYLKKVQDELKAHGLKETETLYDPKTGRRLGEVTVGPHYVFQLEHQIDKKTHVRSGGPPLTQAEAPKLHYDADTKIPRGGGHHGAQSLGALGIYSALASGLHSNLQEMQTLKCFVWSTPVLTEQGAVPIGKIVNQHMDVRVLSWNEKTEALEYKKITNYWKRDRKDSDRMVELHVHGSNDMGVYRTRKIKCTESHKIYTADGRKINAVDAAGEHLVTPGLVLSPSQHALLVGSLLGDGSLLRHNGPFPHFQERHCQAQEEYLRFKKDMLQDLSERDLHSYNAGREGFNCDQPMVEWSTKAHPGLSELWERFYPQGTRTVPEGLDSLLSPFAVAVWYQDDGSLVQGERQRILRIHLGTVGKEAAERAAVALSARTGASFTTSYAPQPYNGRVSEQWNLRLGNAEEIDKFIEYVRPYVHPSMAYKVEGRDCGWALEELLEAPSRTKIFPVKVLKVVPYTATRFDGSCLFDLEVEDTHNYFAHGIRVSNSDEPQARAVWAALTNGDRLPPPKVPFVYKRFEAMLQGLGVNLEKDGTMTRLVPRTDEETRKLSRGELSRPTRGIRGKDDAPERGGLFDPIVTGGREGQHWSHIELAERMPHPVYAEAISKTLSIKPSDIPEILAGKKQLNGKTGAKAFEDALSKLNIDAELKTLREQLASPRLKGSELNKAHFKYKALETLKSAGKKPVDVWMIKAVPVIPPVFRPVATMPDNTTRNNPLNTLYRRLGMVNETLQRGAAVGVPWDAQLDARAGLYQELNNLFGTTPKGKKALDLDMRGTKEDTNKKLPGIIHMISGEQPKDGFFQDKMIGKKQDYTARATIVADPNLSVDQLGVPRKIAMELMRPMVAQRLIRSGYDAIKANLMVSRKDPVAMRALEEEIKHRPVLMKRDPVLHQYGLVGQHVKLVDHEAITMSPLVLPPIGGDLDGDTVSLYVPLGQHAVEEIKRIVPSARTISASSGDVLYTPANESALSLYRVSLGRKKTGQVFADQAAAEKAFKENKIDLDSVVHIKGVGDTTLGRVRIAHVVPEAYKAQVLTKLDVPFDRKMQNKILSDVAKNQPKHFVELADNMSRLGFQMAYETGHSVTLKDLEPLRKERDTIVQAAQKRVDALPRTEKGRQEATKIWLDATKQLHDTYGDHYTKHPTNVSDMAVSGIKAKKEQFQGLVMAPMLVEDHLGRPSKIPITKSFSEGIDVGGYFVQAAGARRGVIQKVESVSEPGYMSKLLVQMSIDQPVMARDCGTTQGISMGIKDRDIVDRHLAAPVKIGNITHPAGTVVTPDMLHHADKERVTQLQVRSPLKCRLPQGVCSRCMGTHPSGHEYSIGENVGVIAAQALGERAAQLMLKQTHGGGIVSLSPHSVRDFSDVQAMLNAAKPGLEDAVVATRDTKINRVEPLRQGSWELHFEGSKKPVYTRQKPLEHVKPGYVAKRGEVLTQGNPNIHSVLEAQGIEAVQNYMTKRIGDIYGREGVLRRHVELGVRNVAGLVRVEDPGEHSGILRGDYMMKPTADALNHTNPNKAPIKYEATLKPMESIPLRRQKDFVARLQGENISRSLTVAVQHGHSTDHAGIHPIPGLAHGAGYNPRRGTDANR